MMVWIGDGLEAVDCTSTEICKSNPLVAMIYRKLAIIIDRFSDQYQFWPIWLALRRKRGGKKRGTREEHKANV